MSDSGHTLVNKQFGPRAAAYVQSAVHASGEDLTALAGFAAQHSFGRALDLGCGGGHVSFVLAGHVREIVAYDLSAEMLEAVTQEAARRGIGNLQTRQGMVEHLPFDDASFDFVASRYSAHHWQDIDAALCEARRVLKRGARALFMDAFAPDAPLFDTFLQSMEMLRDPSHVRDYSLAEWTAKVRAAGFEPLAPVARKVRLDFASWIARMQTRPVYADAIRALQGDVPGEVVRYFAIEADGSFMLDSMSLEAVAV